MCRKAEYSLVLGVVSLFRFRFEGTHANDAKGLCVCGEEVEDGGQSDEEVPIKGQCLLCPVKLFCPVIQKPLNWWIRMHEACVYVPLCVVAVAAVGAYLLCIHPNISFRQYIRWICNDLLTQHCIISSIPLMYCNRSGIWGSLRIYEYC